MGLNNVRSCGLLIAFDLDNKKDRDSFIYRSRNNGLLLNSAGDISIRIRPNLAVTETETCHSLDIIKKVIK
jgi:L-lysine 6-transaminase